MLSSKRTYSSITQKGCMMWYGPYRLLIYYRIRVGGCEYKIFRTLDLLLAYKRLVETSYNKYAWQKLS